MAKKRKGPAELCHSQSITEEMYKRVEKLHLENWDKKELTYGQLQEVGIKWRPNDQMTMVASGNRTGEMMHGENVCSAGDLVCHEPNPKGHTGEEDYNIYHWTVTTSSASGSSGTTYAQYYFNIYSSGADIGSHHPKNEEIYKDDFWNKVQPLEKKE